MSQQHQQLISDISVIKFKTSKRSKDFYERLSKDKTEPSPFLSKDEAAKFWAHLNPTPFPKALRSEGKSCSNTLDTIGPLKKDIKDIVLLHLFSSAHSTSHVTMFGPEAHPVFRTRTIQPSVNATDSKDNDASVKPPRPSPPSPKKQPKGTRAQLALLVESKVIPKSDHPSFQEMFPSTDLPHVNMINGLPKCKKSTFNALLISKLRAAKSCLKLKSTDRLPKAIVLHISRLIDLSIVNRLNDLKTKIKAKTQPAPKQKKKQQKKKQKKTTRVVEFISATSTGPETSVPPPQPTLPQPTRNTVAEQTPITPIDPHSIAHLSLNDVKLIQSIYSDVKQGASLQSYHDRIVSLGPQVLLRILQPKEFEIQNLDARLTFASKLLDCFQADNLSFFDKWTLTDIPLDRFTLDSSNVAMIRDLPTIKDRVKNKFAQLSPALVLNRPDQMPVSHVELSSKIIIDNLPDGFPSLTPHCR
jgi:hypothetical protein